MRIPAIVDRRHLHLTINRKLDGIDADSIHTGPKRREGGAAQAPITLSSIHCRIPWC